MIQTRFIFMKLLPKAISGLLLVLLLSGIVYTPSIKASAEDEAFCKSADFVDNFLDKNLMSEEDCLQMAKLFSSENAPTDGPWYNQNFRQFSTKVMDTSNPDEIFGERYTYAQINWIINSIATMLNPAAGVKSASDLLQFLKLAGDILGKLSMNQQPTIQEYAQLGPMGMFPMAFNTMYMNPPASANQEVKMLAEKLSIVEPANAQGYGYASLFGSGSNGTGVRLLWQASRNATYLVMVVFLIAAGFMIMFRLKINPQTVISLQIIIPKLIFSMILVTFSFAIAGLIIDLIYVVLATIIGLLSLSGVVTNAGRLTPLLASGGFFGYASAQALVSLIMTTILVIGIESAALLPFLIAGPAWAPFAAGFSLVSIILGIGLAIFWIWILGRIAIMLIKSYVMLLLQIIIAPWQIMLGMFPGQAGFSGWLRNTIAHASVFVVVPVMFIIQHVIAPDFTNIFFGLPTDLSLPQVRLPILPNPPSMIMGMLIGFTVLALTPKVAEMIRDALKIPAFKYGSALGESLGPIGTFGGAIAGRGAPGQFEVEAAKQNALRPGATADDISRYNDLLRQGDWSKRAQGWMNEIKKAKA
jgi:hypothetical protein